MYCQDLVVTDVLPQMVALSETYFQVYQCTSPQPQRLGGGQKGGKVANSVAASGGKSSGKASAAQAATGS